MQHGEWYCVLRTEPGALGQDAHADKIRHAAYNWAARQGLRAETRSAARGAELYVRFMAKGGAVRGPR